ncbi:MAG: FdhF/YdeP family oxidoreductase [Roseivirga sp.]|uniref:FdhF/YdeP family oxidoreductase n=1 Tax=Roseivirga sp. TaxID=1964215 RepID=UPI001B09C154|nr:FdhF/YdeP family oxidoreductase [Roseivirga sp.]MBO6659654.1 FdhF/YdeP family oxidoreductase [Roseivirga sp.]MBO6907609.1 FdhF/YdeP family oxidoreductase [Roseivirga sp.]
MSESNKEIKVQPPEKFTGLKFDGPKESSVGKAAIASAMGQMAKYMKPADAIKLSLKINQKGGFDCPGCAWPDPDDDRSSIGEYCENGIKAIAEEAQKKALTSEFFSKYSVQEISELSDFEMGKTGRLTEPMFLDEDSNHYKSISWTEAFQLIAKELNQLNSPDEALFYTSGRTSNEAAYLYQLFVRAYGTNNLPDCSNMCHESSGVALSETVGIGKGSVTLQDIHEAEVLIIMGQNPGTNHPRMLSAIEKCKVNGGKVISVNPLPEAGLIKYTDPQSPKRMLTNGIKITDLFLPIKINGDVAFLKALMYELHKMDIDQGGDLIDYDFIAKHTNGYEDFIKAISQIDYMACLRQCGLEAKDVRAAAKMIARKEKIIVCWAMGLTQHENGVDNIKELVNLLLMKGAIGKPGAGTCPVRGHSNVQGDRTMGIWEAPKDSFLDKLDEVHGIKSPRAHGLAVVPAINAMHEGKAKVFFAMGGNFLSATPDTDFTAKALQNCNLTVHVSTKLNRSHVVHGKKALILPCLGRTDKDIQNGQEQFVSCENSMGVVQSSQGVLSPPSKHLLSEVRIVAELAKATLKNSKIDWEGLASNYDNIRAAIEKVIPGFEQYNKKVRKPGGFYLPNGAREGKFNTTSGKAEFTVIDLPKHELAEDEFVMMTIRSHDQYNTTIYGLNDRYRGIYNERRVVMMNEEDMRDKGFKKGDVVNLTSHFNGIERRANQFIVLPYPIPRTNVATYFPEANALVPIDSFARKSMTPASKMVRIKIEKAE